MKAAVALSVLLWVTPIFAKEDTPPNVVMIISDDQGWSDYGFMGHPDIETPNLDKLAKRSLLFTRGYVTSPICRPSLASIASGLYQHEHGITANDTQQTNFRELQNLIDRGKLNRPIFDSFNSGPSLIKELVRNGYLAMQTGKWWEGSWQDGGFTHGMTHGDHARRGRHGDEGLKIGRTGMEPIKSFLDEAQAEDQPFFIWYAPFLPHTPHTPPDRLLEKYRKVGVPEEISKYYAMCDWFDETCGQLIDEINQRGLSKNTLFVYVCDNGWAQLESYEGTIPADWSQAYAPKSKGSPYENGARTPIFLSLPGKIDPELSLKPVSSIDIFPTIMSICGFDTPEGLTGVDLTDREAVKSREAVFGAVYSSHNMDFGNHLKTLQYRYVISDNWKYIDRHFGLDSSEKYQCLHNWDYTPEHLYAINLDPFEKKNLAESHPDKAAAMKALLDDWMPIPSGN